MDASARRLLDAYVATFNESVRAHDFARLAEWFAEDAELVFEGVPVGPFQGRDAIATAYETQPPDDEVEILGAHDGDAGEIVARYAWRRDEGKAAGDMRLLPRDGRIARLVVTFD